MGLGYVGWCWSDAENGGGEGRRITESDLGDELVDAAVAKIGQRRRWGWGGAFERG